MSIAVEHFYEYRSPSGVISDLDIASAEGGRTENDIGTLTLILPGNIYSVRDFDQDGEIYVRRSIGGAEPTLLGKTFFFVDPKIRHQTTEEGEKQLVLTCSDPISLIKRRIVAYYAGNAYTSRADLSDDLVKAIMRENYGASAVDATRNLSARLTIQGDLSLGTAVTDDIAWQQIDSVISNLCEQSWAYNYRLLFDFIATGYGTLDFQTYIGYSGIDHSSDSGDPIVVSDEDGTLAEGYYEEDYTDEFNSTYVGGRGYEDRRNVQNAQDAARVGASFWNLREKFIGEVNTTSATKILNAANRELSKGRPIKRQGGRIIQVEGVTFGLDFDYGDLITTEYIGNSMDARLATFHWTYDQDNGELMDLYAHGEQYG